MYIFIHSMRYFDVISPTTTVMWLLSVFGYTGTLEPSAFSVERKPRRDLSTIIHILNDLLNAVPHYKPHSFLHPPQRSSSDPKYSGRLRKQHLLTSTGPTVNTPPPPQIFIIHTWVWLSSALERYLGLIYSINMNAFVVNLKAVFTMLSPWAFLYVIINIYSVQFSTSSNLKIHM